MTERRESIEPEDAYEVQALATALSEARIRAMSHLMRKWRLAPEQAAQHLDYDDLDDLLPEQITWRDLSCVGDEQVLAAWNRIKDHAIDQLRSGRRAAEALEGTGSPFERARFLVLRAELIESWLPQNAIERTLVESLAQTQTIWEYWTGIHLQQARFLAETASDVLAERGPRPSGTEDLLEAPRLDRAEAMNQSAEMADRFNRLILRTVRALRDLRRYSSNVTVQHAEQVNIGNQQINSNRP